MRFANEQLSIAVAAGSLRLSQDKKDRQMTQAKAGETVKLNVKTADDTKAKAKSPKVKAPETKVVQSASKVVTAGVIKKPDFLDKAVDRSGVKRRDAKPAIEAALSELAEALLRGDELNLPPLGKIKVVKAKTLGEGAQALTLKLRTMKEGAGTGGASEDDDDQ